MNNFDSASLVGGDFMISINNKALKLTNLAGAISVENN